MIKPMSQQDLPLPEAPNGSKRGAGRAGRPPKAADERQAQQVAIRLGRDEWNLLRERAKNRSLPMATYMRVQLLAAAASTSPPGPLPEREEGAPEGRREHGMSLRLSEAEFETIAAVAGGRPNIGSYIRLLLRLPEL